MKELDKNKILDKVEDAFDIAKDMTLVEDYRTVDLLRLIDLEFEDIVSIINPLQDTDLHNDN